PPHHAQRPPPTRTHCKLHYAQCRPIRSRLPFCGYTPLSIPVLETVHVNIPELRDVIVRGPRDRGNVDGVIVTSKRSCEAWGEALSFALSGLHSGYRSSSDANTNASESAAVDASHTGVAQWSKSLLRRRPHNLPNPPKHLYLPTPPYPPIRGENSGSAAALAPLILQDIRDQGHSRANADASPRLLYLTGDKNRDTLPQVLGEGGVELEEVQVYVTQGSVAFEGGWRLRSPLRLSPPLLLGLLLPAIPFLHLILRRPSPSSTTGETTPSSNTWWITYFAPSAASFVTPILQKHFLLPSSSSSSSVPPNPPPSSSSSSTTPTPSITLDLNPKSYAKQR
ncbi:hypothetical protein CPB84DRAFT_1966328, partial [Gymnopilus junonius]